MTYYRYCLYSLYMPIYLPYFLTVNLAQSVKTLKRCYDGVAARSCVRVTSASYFFHIFFQRLTDEMYKIALLSY